jgi:hypothetical protein
MSLPISSSMGLTARSPEPLDFGLAARMKIADVRSSGVGHFAFGALGERRSR